MMRSHGQGEVEPIRTFCGQRRQGSNFYDFVQTSFMDDPLNIFNVH